MLVECLACFVRLKEKVREEAVGCRREMLKGLARPIYWRGRNFFLVCCGERKREVGRRDGGIERLK